jgi:hypothetical protein
MSYADFEETTAAPRDMKRDMGYGDADQVRTHVATLLCVKRRDFLVFAGTARPFVDHDDDGRLRPPVSARRRFRGACGCGTVARSSPRGASGLVACASSPVTARHLAPDGDSRCHSVPEVDLVRYRHFLAFILILPKVNSNVRLPQLNAIGPILAKLLIPMFVGGGNSAGYYATRNTHWPSRVKFSVALLFLISDSKSARFHTDAVVKENSGHFLNFCTDRRMFRKERTVLSGGGTGRRSDEECRKSYTA